MPSNKEKPLGSYPNTDYNFFAAMNDKISREKTPGEIELTSFVFKEAYSQMAKESEDRLDSLISKITAKGVDVKKASRQQKDSEDVFVLEANPIDLSIVQGERRTTIMFLPDLKMKYEPKDLYELFFKKIPTSMYGNGPHAPKPQDIKNETNVNVTLSKENRKTYKLGTPSGKEGFEQLMKEPEEVLWVVMEISTDRGVSYKINLPNPQRVQDRYLQFSFPSRDVFQDKTMDVLLKLHRDYEKLNGDNSSYSSSFAASVNLIREQLRVR